MLLSSYAKAQKLIEQLPDLIIVASHDLNADKEVERAKNAQTGRN